VSSSTPSQSRTDSKLEYAELHLEEIETRLDKGGSESDAFEIAHEESFLFHLMGAKDAFLHEINDALGKPLPMKDVREMTLEDELEAKGATSPALTELRKLQFDPSSWLAFATECRNHGTHRHRVPRNYYDGVARRVEIRHPVSGQVMGEVPAILRSWLDEMQALILRLRPMV